MAESNRRRRRKQYVEMNGKSGDKRFYKTTLDNTFSCKQKLFVPPSKHVLEEGVEKTGGGELLGRNNIVIIILLRNVG